jgi:hypothetical protein
MPARGSHRKLSWTGTVISIGTGMFAGCAGRGWARWMMARLS